MNKIDIKGLTYRQVENLIQELGEPKYRAKQIFEWIHKKNIMSFYEMKNIKKELIQSLQDKTELIKLKIQEKFTSEIDGTTKYLLKLHDDNIIESVLMKQSYGNSVCISSQVGCRMGCTFCASTLSGVVRSLTASEMLDQVYVMQRDLGDRVSHIVIMGSGEPLDNLQEVLKFINIINDENGLNIGQRHITLSTCGLVDKMYDLIDQNLQINLAISLHASNDDVRRKIMPIAKKYPMEELIEVAKKYTEATGRRITFEYTLIEDVNDKVEQAKELSKILKGMLCHVNLIPMNEVKERNYKKSNTEAVKRFQKMLLDNKIQVTIRKKLGNDIDAACGQLRRQYLKR